MVPPGGDWRYLPPDEGRRRLRGAAGACGGKTGWYRRLSMDAPCPTILGAPNHIATALCHPLETRALSLRECARVQEFPDDWAFCGGLRQKYLQIGNAVPVRLASVATSVAAAVLDAGAETTAPLERFSVVSLQPGVRIRRAKEGRVVVRQPDAVDRQRRAA